MPWGRLDDEANGNAKLLCLSDSAWRMWGCGLIYCQANLTDGFIPTFAIETFGVRARNKRSVAQELCTPQVVGKAALWLATAGGYQVHDYLQWNDARSTVVAKRAIADVRRQLYTNKELLIVIRERDGNQCRYCGVLVNWKDRRGPQGATYDHILAAGGNSVDNVVVACRGCNSSKGQRTPDEAGMNLRPPLNPIQNQSSLNLDSGKSESTHHVPRTISTSDLNDTYGGAGAPRFSQAVDKSDAKASNWKRALGIAHAVITAWPNNRENWTYETKGRLQEQHLDPHERSPRGGALFTDAVDYAIQQRREQDPKKARTS